MQRFHIYLSQQQRKRLDAESRKTGIPIAELIRRKIDSSEHFARDIGKKEKSSCQNGNLIGSRLHEILKACFPEELNDDEEVSEVAMRLLDRLYRWSH